MIEQCEWKTTLRWRKGNGVSAVCVDWASGPGNGGGARFGAGNFASLGACRRGRGARFARCKGGLGISRRDTKDGEKSSAASDGHARDGTDFSRRGRNCKGVRPDRHPGKQCGDRARKSGRECTGGRL